MGKKVMSLQASLKIAKQNKHESNNKRQIKNLIEVLRPKVYITDSSNFKSLVQELTGNGSSSNTMSSPASPGRKETVIEHNNSLVIDIIEDDGDKKAACSFDASMTVFDSFECCCHNIVSYEGFGEASDNQMNQLGEDYWLAYQDLESWL